jgi:hypothetical protein
MSIKSRLIQKLVFIFLLLNLSACPILFVGMVFFPQAVHFLEPVVCPADTNMEVVSEQGLDSDGAFIWVKVFCIDDRQELDVTWKLFAFMFGLPALGVIVFLITPSSKENQDLDYSQSEWD